MAKKRKLNTIIVSRPNTPDALPVRASTYHRQKGRLVSSNKILTTKDHVGEDTPHLNPWQDEFFEAFAVDVGGTSDLASGGEQVPKVGFDFSTMLSKLTKESGRPFFN
jgi:hypothetical protein